MLQRSLPPTGAHSAQGSKAEITSWAVSQLRSPHLGAEAREAWVSLGYIRLWSKSLPPVTQDEQKPSSYCLDMQGLKGKSSFSCLTPCTAFKTQLICWTN